jgi:predicted nucleotide-binding protein
MQTVGVCHGDSMRSDTDPQPGIHHLLDEGKRLQRDAHLTCTPASERRLRAQSAQWCARVLAATGLDVSVGPEREQAPDFGLGTALRMLQTNTGLLHPVNGRDDRVFVVHGQDSGRRETVARLLETLGLEVVILDERPMRGRALLEKFEQEVADIGYAVVIARPEDRGAGPGQALPNEPNRPRQNVILEIGYFMGLIGRQRVTVLHEAPLELPSDLDGFGYIAMEDEWRYRLARELAAAKMKVDTTRLLGN